MKALFRQQVPGYIEKHFLERDLQNLEAIGLQDITIESLRVDI